MAARGLHQQVVQWAVGDSEPVEAIDADAGSKARVLQVVAGVGYVRGHRAGANIEPTRCRLWITARCATGVRG